VTIDLDENEKQTVVNALTYVSQGLTVEQRDEFNHVANIVDKVKATIISLGKPSEGE
jgi:hypothetical protein